MRLSRHISYELAVVTLVCSATLFFFPAGSGSYSAVHGPVTALRSVNKSVAAWLSLVVAVLHAFKIQMPASLTLSGARQNGVLLARSSPPETISVLRR